MSGELHAVWNWVLAAADGACEAQSQPFAGTFQLADVLHMTTYLPRLTDAPQACKACPQLKPSHMLNLLPIPVSVEPQSPKAPLDQVIGVFSHHQRQSPVELALCHFVVVQSLEASGK